MTATIVDLAVRGYLKIEEVDEGVVPAQARLEAHRSCPRTASCAATSGRCYDGLFRDGDEVKLSDLHNKFAERMRKVREQLMDDAMSKGWFARKPGTVKVLYGVARASSSLAGGVGAHDPARGLRRTPRCSACR